MIRLAFDDSARSRPGSDRGLGRFSSWWSQGWALADNVDLVPLHYPVSHARGAELFESLSRQKALSRADVDVLHVTSPMHLPVLKKHRWICSVQDLIALDDRRYRRTGLKNRLAVRQLDRADIVITNAGYTAERILHFSRLAPAAITVIPLPVGQVFFDAGTQGWSGSEYVLAMADLRTPDPRKRSRWLPALEAALEQSGLSLVVAGPTSTDRSGTPFRRPVGRVPDGELAALMRGAVCFVSLSQYEGQGLPPLEAMATGTPVVAYRNTATEESVGVDEFLVDDPGVDEDEPFPERALQQLVERITTFRENVEHYRALALNRAGVYRPEKFFALVDSLARELER